MKRIVATRKQNRGNRRKNNVFWQQKVVGNKKVKKILNQKAEKRALFDELQKHTKNKNINRRDLRAALATMKYDTSNPISAREARVIGKELGVPKIKLRHLRKDDAKEIDRRAEFDHRQDRSQSEKTNRINDADIDVIDRRAGLDHRDNRVHGKQREYVQENGPKEIDRRARLDPRSDRSPQKQKNHLSAIDLINKSHRASHKLAGVDTNDTSPTIRKSFAASGNHSATIDSVGTLGHLGSHSGSGRVNKSF